MKRLVLLVGLASAIGCDGNPAEGSSPHGVSADAFVGHWKSTTPSLEFARLEVSSPSSGQSTLTAHLTLSGVAFDAAGRIDGDSLVAPMSITGSTQPGGTIAIRALSNGTLSAELRPIGDSFLPTLMFTRE